MRTEGLEWHRASSGAAMPEGHAFERSCTMHGVQPSGDVDESHDGSARPACGIRAGRPRRARGANHWAESRARQRSDLHEGPSRRFSRRTARSAISRAPSGRCRSSPIRTRGATPAGSAGWSNPAICRRTSTITDVGIQDLKEDWRMSDEKIATITAWVAAGSPEGDPADMPPAGRVA